MQEPGSMKEAGTLQLANMFPEGTVIGQHTKNRNRVKVRIPQYHTGIADDDLPYYRILGPTTSNGHNGRSGHKSTIAVGTKVLVLIYDPRGYNGIVLGCLPNDSNVVGDDDSLYYYRDEIGNTFNVDTSGNMTMTNADGAVISMQRGGKVAITANELKLNIGTMSIDAATLTMLATTLGMTANDWSVSAANPTIVDGNGGGGGSGHTPSLTAPTLPDAPDVSNRMDD